MGDGEKKLSFSCERLSTEEKGEARVEWLVRNGLFEVRDSLVTIDRDIAVKDYDRKG